MKSKLERFGRGASVAVLALWLSVGAGARAQDYTLMDLGSADGTISSAFAINDSGQVIGFTATSENNLWGLYWEPALPMDPCILCPVPPGMGLNQAQVFDINDDGLAAGISYNLGDANITGLNWLSAPIWDTEAVEHPGFSARGINGAGDIAGFNIYSTATLGLVEQAAWLLGDTVAWLPTLGGTFSYAYDINDVGQVVGVSYLTGDTTRHAALWQAGFPHDLGTLGGTNSQAYAISNAGHVVGHSDAPGGLIRAFLCTVDPAGNVLQKFDLGALNNTHSYGLGVNDGGVVVGSSDARAFMWSGGILTDLNDVVPASAHWRLERARDVNNSGQIVGEGYHSGWRRAFMLSPWVCIGDANVDGYVTLPDWAIVVQNLGAEHGATREMGDFDGDGDVDLADVATFAGVFHGYVNDCAQY